MTISGPVRPPVRWRRSLAASAVTVLLTGGVGLAGASAAQATPAAPTLAPARAADTGARISSVDNVSQGQIDLTIDSPSLGRSVKTRIVLPSGWVEGSTTKYPVVYAYHGGQNNYADSWPKETAIEEWAQKAGVILVMPEGANGSYVDWRNYGRRGKPMWETFHTTEVMQLVERNYGASTVRAAIGNSSGGYGAMVYAARHPGMFRYAASLSGTVYLREGAMPALLMFTNAGNMQDPYKIWGIPWADDENWKQHDPAFLADRLKGTGLFFSAGTTGRPGPGDPNVAPWDIGLLSEIAIGNNNKEFKKVLDAKGVPHTAHIYRDGRHDWPAWRRESAFIWPAIVKAIGGRSS